LLISSYLYAVGLFILNSYFQIINGYMASTKHIENSAGIQHQRHNFGKYSHESHYPDFLDIQLKSFEEFFQLETTPENRAEEGLYQVFQENFPIVDTRNVFVLDFINYFVDPPRYSMDECMDRGLTYSVPLKAKLRLSCNDEEHEDFKQTVQDVFLGNIPYMTPKGTFIINGAERVVVSQLHRSPGVFFGQSRHPNGTKIYSARVIPFKGAWMEFATDINSVMYAYIDRKKKFPVTTLLRAIGFDSDKEILNLFGLAEEVPTTRDMLTSHVGRKLAARVLDSWTEDFVDEETGEVVSIERNTIILERDTILDENNIEDILAVENLATIILQREDIEEDYSIIYNTLQKDTSNSEIEAVKHIYRQLRGAEPPDDETARGIIDKLFFSDKRYSLGEVGRYKINRKLELQTSKDTIVLTKEDIIAIVKYLVRLMNQKAEIDDIDHLSNRRVRTVGEQLYAQFGVGLARMARTIRERMNVRDNEVFTPVDLINARTLSSVINSFFGTSQLSQFLDQTNPLSEITHKRRISALGPGGLSRERAGFEVRDVHYSHYGRLCTIETPEGPNIGLISTLCVHAKINKMGFIETAYREINDGRANLQDFRYLSAEEEDDKIVAQANVIDPENGNFFSDTLFCREQGEFLQKPLEEVDFVDVSPNQIVGVSASLIPFLSHDDANRALMGSNMQRQAVPLLRPSSPIVGTGLEAKVAKDSRMLINAEGKGIVEFVDANKIVIRYERSDDDRLVSFEDDCVTYDLIKFRRTNQNTCINLKPIVTKNEPVWEGKILCEGYATEKGELALGQNLKVAFMPWKGYNFEDAIVISERVVREDIFTSVHIEEFELDVRETKLGEEEFTSDIPNVSEEATKDLDENGVIRIGAWIREGDIIIGKITPKGESDPTPEEKLLRAIFGDKAGDVKDASLKAPPSMQGVVIGKRLFQRAKKDKVQKVKDKKNLTKLDETYEVEIGELRRQLIEKLVELLKGKTSQGVKSIYGDLLIPKGTKLTEKHLTEVDFDVVDPMNWTDDEKANKLLRQLLHNFNIKENQATSIYKRDKFAITIGDELPAGVLKLAKVYLAKKRKLRVGDKLAGRHGNKGIVARIVRDEDMPFLHDGTPVDIVLNPMGVPSRMNLGQIFETVLGWAGQKMNMKFSTPVFDEASLDDIEDFIVKAELPSSGQTYLYDGETGDRFHQKATVGVIYMIKLSHMVDDKMHARSIGPYSLITQQPLGGKAQFGGQRFGEMEVWALEAFGAANILQELLTIKSDDIVGRAKAYEAIVKGDNLPTPSVPESFNVLVHELRGLALEVRFD
jgi:DNA-directed RNA polymerase subunit beta